MTERHTTFFHSFQLSQQIRTETLTTQVTTTTTATTTTIY